MVNAGDIVRASNIAVQACRVNRTAVQSIPDATYTIVAFNSERYDHGGMHSNVTNNSRVTIQTDGVYDMGFSGRFASGNDYVQTQAVILLNGSISLVQSQTPGTTNTTPQRVSVATQYELVVGDYIEVQVYQDNSANAARNLELNDAYSPEFWVGRLGS